MASPVTALPTSADVCRAPTSGGAMLYDASRTGNAAENLFRAEWWQSRATVSPARSGRGGTVYIDDARRSWVLRHYCRGGSVAKVLDDRYLWTGEERTRPFREWRLLRDLHVTGLPVPVPVAAQYRRTGAFYRGDLITERIPAAESLSQLLGDRNVPPGSWRDIGACVRRFHDLGVFHADLNAHNILLDAAGRVFVIDFDRGERRPPGAWQAANLARLKRSLDKVRGSQQEDDWHAFLAGYGTPSGASPPAGSAGDTAR
jgi:3-deoxy-D-manno-octulosonic acid kinase